jgi:hypothetical protein
LRIKHEKLLLSSSTGVLSTRYEIGVYVGKFDGCGIECTYSDSEDEVSHADFVTIVEIRMGQPRGHLNGFFSVYVSSIKAFPVEHAQPRWINVKPTVMPGYVHVVVMARNTQVAIGGPPDGDYSRLRVNQTLPGKRAPRDG